MTDFYDISAPVDFVNTSPGDILDFNAVSGSGNNVIRDFVANTQGDLLVGDANSGLTRTAIGTSGQVLTATATANETFTVDTSVVATTL
jgi:hypothetical protein